MNGPVDDRQEVPEVVGLWHWPNEVDLEGLEVGQLSLEVAGLDMFVLLIFTCWHTGHCCLSKSLWQQEDGPSFGLGGMAR